MVTCFSHFSLPIKGTSSHNSRRSLSLFSLSQEMAFSFRASSSFLLFCPNLLAIILLIINCSPSSARLSVKVTSDVVNYVCGLSRNSPTCYKVLKSDPRTATVDLRGLVQVTIDHAHANATGTHTLINSLIKQTTDPQLKERYTMCFDAYGATIKDLEDATRYLSSSDYNSVRSISIATNREAVKCESRFGTSPDEPHLLDIPNNDLVTLGDMTVIICNRLLAGFI